MLISISTAHLRITKIIIIEILIIIMIRSIIIIAIA